MFPHLLSFLVHFGFSGWVSMHPTSLNQLAFLKSENGRPRGSLLLIEAFKHTIWLVAPPRHLEPGQTDLVGEMRRASEGGTPGLGQARGIRGHAAGECARGSLGRACFAFAIGSTRWNGRCSFLSPLGTKQRRTCKGVASRKGQTQMVDGQPPPR